MAATKEEKGGPAKDEKNDKSKTDGVITAVYKVNLHCRQCACDIKKPLLKTQGVHGVEVEVEKGEIKVKGEIDVIKIHKKIEKLSKKKVELISPKMKDIVKEKAPATPNKAKETKEPILRTTTVKVHLHCDKCGEDLRNKLLKHKGIYSVKIDTKAQTVTVKGTIEPHKLLSYIKEKVHKHAEIISSKTDQEKEEKKENVKDEDKKEDPKAGVESSQKIEEIVKVEVKKEDPKTGVESSLKIEDIVKVEAKKEDQKAGVESSQKIEVIEYKQEAKVEVKSDDGNSLYFVHYVYAPQLFSDENPNACSII